MMIGSKARYAVMAISDLAARNSKRPVSLHELSLGQHIPLPYLEQIFAKLRKAGVVTSARGPRGGYKLVKSPSLVTIFDIVDAVGEPLKMTRCENELQGCLSDGVRCSTHDLWDGLAQHIKEYLQAVTIADVVADRLKNTPGCTHFENIFINTVPTKIIGEP